MLIYLTSCAEKTLEKLIPLLPKSPHQMKVAFIPTAGDVYNKTPWIDDDRAKLLELGFQIDDVDIKNQTVEKLKEKLDNTDIIFVAGGNTIYLLEQMQKSKCMNLIRDKVNNGMIYIGSSAGSIIAGPSVETDKVYEDTEDYKVTLNSYDGLHLVDFVVIPHENKSDYVPYHQRILEQFKDKYQFKVLKDNQAILVSGNDTQLIEI